MRIFLLFLSFLIPLVAFTQSGAEQILIAHRGGVVDSLRSENSFSALGEAIRRGYTHVEVDVRATADGHVVCFHNDDLKDEAGIDGKISELSFDSVTNIMLTRSKERIPSFKDYAAKCAGRIGIMVDLKGCPDRHIESYAKGIIDGLKAYGLLKDALILINKTPKNNQDKLVPYFLGKAKVSFRRSLQEAQVTANGDVHFASNYYVFNHGADFSKKEIKGFQQLGLKVIVSINIGHYRLGNPEKEGKKHVRKMLKYKADGLQIDSVYDPLVFE